MATTTAADLAAVVEALRGHDRFLVTTHENPDGDALGSLLAMHLALAAARQGQRHVPRRRRRRSRASTASWRSTSLQRELPADAGERVLRRRRLREREPARRRPRDALARARRSRSTSTTTTTTPASATSTSSSPTRRRRRRCCATSSRELGVELTPEIAEPLYSALVTDTGRFQYANTTPKALRLAAELVEAGADVHKVFQGVYESVQFAKLKLLARALERAQVYEGGRLVVSYLLRDDFAEVGAAEPYSEGIIDYLRAVEGAEMAALIREPPRGGSPARRVSLRVVARRARRLGDRPRAPGGGGHRQAAGFSSDESIEEITAVPRPARSPKHGRDAAAGARADRDHPGRQAGGAVVVRDREPGARAAPGARMGHAGTLDPFATGLLLLLSGRATKLAAIVRRARQALPRRTST